MKKASFIFSFIILSLSLTSCFSTSGDGSVESALDKLVAPKVEYKVVKIDDLYSIKIPDFMTATNLLQQDASLQYNNPFKEKYIIVLNEKRDEIMAFMNDYGVYDDSKSMLENYADTRLSYLKESGITVINQTELKSEMINGRKALSTTLEASVPDISEDIAYYYTYIEGTDNFYMIMSWTLLNRKDAYTEEVEVMTSSFKEL